MVKFEKTDNEVIIGALSHWAMGNDFIFDIKNEVINIERYKFIYSEIISISIAVNQV